MRIDRTTMTIRPPLSCPCHATDIGPKGTDCEKEMLRMERKLLDLDSDLIRGSGMTSSWLYKYNRGF